MIGFGAGGGRLGRLPRAGRLSFTPPLRFLSVLPSLMTTLAISLFESSVLEVAERLEDNNITSTDL